MESITPSDKERNKQESSTCTFWYAMRATYRREMKILDDMKGHQIPAFVPMATRYEKKGRRVIRITEPAVHSLIFIYASQEWLQAYKTQHPELQYIMRHKDGQKVKTIVAEREMANFIAVCTSDDAQLSIIPSQELAIAPGQLVRITSGPLEGRIGTFQRVKGSRDRRFVVQISGLVAAISTIVRADQIEPYQEGA